MKTYGVQMFADITGVSIRTLQRWHNKGLLVADKTPGGRRFYTDKHKREVLGLPVAGT